MEFRKDINGLRSIAIITVLLFHFKSIWMPGGFTGVDIFYVISGFLMTEIIYKGLEKNNFSLFKFYIARANRIIPPLAILCLVLLIFGWFCLPPDDYKALGKHVGSSMGFFSNIVYWREAGYFDTSSHDKWLLHTWSLSTELQFCIIYPLVLLTMGKLMPAQLLKKTLFAVTILCFTLSVTATYRWPTSSYFLLHTRAWEMLLGGLAHFYPFTLKEANKKCLEWVGIILICGSCFLISAQDPWPGYLAIFPVLGTFLLIQARRIDSPITGNLIFQNIGKWSYSIYLWHWPLVVALFYFSLSGIWVYLAFLASVLIGYLSYQYIERFKFKKNFKTLVGVMISTPLILVPLVGTLGLSIFHYQGYNANNNLKESFSQLEYPRYCHVDSSNNDNDHINCKVGRTSQKPIALIWGDSYAGVLDPFVDHLLTETGHSAISRTTSNCFPSTDLNHMLGGNPQYCKKIRQLNIDEVLSNQYEIIFLAGRWDSMYKKYGEQALASLFDVINMASHHGKLVYLFEQPVYYKYNVSKQFLRHKIFNTPQDPFIRNDEKAAKVNQLINTRLKDKHYPNVYYIDRDILYDQQLHNDYTPDGLPYTHDEGHLSIAGSIAAAQNFKKSRLSNPLYALLDTY